MKISIEGRTFWVNYHHLFCFYRIVTDGGMTRAAEQLGIGPSALSIQIRQFEEQLGFQLFDRSHKKVTPNERGKVMYSYASEIFRLGSEMMEALNDVRSAVKTHINLGSLDAIPKHISVELVLAATQSLNAEVSLHEGKQEYLLQELSQHRLDLLLSNAFPKAEAGKFFSRRIARFPLVVVGARKFLKYKEGFPRSLNGIPMVLPMSDSLVRHEFENYMQQQAIQMPRVVEAQDIMVQKLLALKELGVTVVPEFAVREYINQKELYVLGQVQGVYEDVFLISAVRKIANPIAAHLMKSFKAG